MVTTGMIQPAGAASVANSGMLAPAAKVAAEVSAACTGRATVISEMPSSSRACAPSASLAISCTATLRARSGSTPRFT